MNWLRSLLARRQLDRDLAEEIEQHLDEKVEELIAAGLTRRAARQAARRAFGSVALANERGRAVWRWALVEDLVLDVRYALRQLRRTPAFAAAAIVTLAIGVGANSTVFSLVDALILRPLPYPHADRLVAVRLVDRREDGRAARLDYPTFFDLREAGVVERLVSQRDTAFTLTSGDAPTRLEGAVVGWDLFDALGVHPVEGRGFLASEEAPGTRVVVISHELWTARFQEDAGIVGRSVSLDGAPYVVVGVAPPGFRYPVERRVQVWTTVARDATSDSIQPATKQRGARMIESLALLAPGQSVAEAEARLSAVAARVATEHPDSNRNFPAVVVQPERARMLGPARNGLYALWGAVTLVLLIACANLANMLLARASDRQRELGVRLAIGAARGRVIRQLVTENLVLALLGAALGVGGAALAVAAVGAVLGERMPLVADAAIDWRVLAFTTALAVATSVLVSGPAALAIRRIDLDGTLRGESRGVTAGHDLVRSVLVVGQTAIGFVLLTAATLLAAGLIHVARRDPGLRTTDLLAVSVAVSGERYKKERHVAFTAAMLDELRGLGGVQAAAGGTPLPLTGNEMVIAFNIEARPKPRSDRPRANFAIVTPGYFTTIGARVRDGRDFTEQDDGAHPRVVIINQAFAARFFPGEGVIGQRIAAGALSPLDTGSSPPWREIVGVVSNVRQSPLGGDPEPIYYVPYRQMPWQTPTFLVRSARASTPADVRALVARLEPTAPVRVQTVQGIFDDFLTVPRLAAWLMGSFAAIGLLLSATGLYGLLSYVVQRKTREIGVRMALGASRSEIVGRVLVRAWWLVACGLLIGGFGGSLVARLVVSQIVVPGWGQAMRLLLVYGAVLVTALLAAALPAHRAASVDPVRALRAE